MKKQHQKPHRHAPFDAVQGQKEMDDWFAQLPAEVERLGKEIDSESSQFNSFQLIANICHLNHLRKLNETYTDYNDGQMAVKPELIALLLLRKPYEDNCQIDPAEFDEKVRKINEMAGRYVSQYDMVRTMNRLPKSFEDETTLEKVTNKLMRDETFVRNPGHPEHHFEIDAELFEPLNEVLKAYFGFSVADSIIIRQKAAELINTKYRNAIREADEKAESLRQEVVIFRNTRKLKEDGYLSRNEFVNLQHYPSKKLKVMIGYHFRMLVHYKLEKVYALTADELAGICELPKSIISKFMDIFSCTFGTPVADHEIVGANNLLKSKPVIAYQGTYLIPSYAMFNWCVEPLLESFIKSSSKLSSRYAAIKHDFLLRKAMALFRQMLPDATFYPENLFYGPKEAVCETDGLIAYENTLFIIEAKGQRMTNKAKEGSYQRTEQHLKELIGDAVAQGRRTIAHISSAPFTTFKTKKNETFQIDRARFKNFVIVSLTLEPIGNLTPLMKVANDLNYFSAHEFPWIISIYDLIVFADFIEMPVLFIHYLRRRKRFLEIKNTVVFEETDLLGYFLFNGLYIEPTIEKAEEDQINWLAFENHTDEFNDYYMYKYGYKQRPVVKKSFFASKELKEILKALAVADLKDRFPVMLELLEISSHSIKTWTDQIKVIKKQFIKDGDIHDCSIASSNTYGSLGITYMVGPDETAVDELLQRYCEHKFTTLRAKRWIGIGDISPREGNYHFKCVYLKERAS